MQLKARKLTVTETVFLAATLTAASLTTLEVIPKVMESCRKQSAIVQAEIKSKKLVDPRDAFSMEFLVSGGVGALGTIKLIAAKINGYP